MRASRAAGAVCLMVMLVGGLPPTPARADEPSLADKAAARDLFNEGVALRDKGDPSGALQKFKGAYALWPSPSTGLELGRTHMLQGELIEARERFLETAKLPKKQTESPAAQTARDEAQKLADSLTPRIPTLVFKISGLSNATKVRVALDGRELPAETLGSPRKVNPGKHAVVARAAGASDLNVEVVVEEGQTREVPLAFATTAVVPPTPTTAPASSPPISDEKPRTTSPLVYVGFGVAGAGVVLGSISGLLASSKASALKNECTDGRCPPAAHDDVDAYHRWGTISTISFIAAGVGAVVGVYGLISSGSRTDTHARVTPWIGVGSAGLAGAF